jgi:hypothetical protein
MTTCIIWRKGVLSTEPPNTTLRHTLGWWRDHLHHSPGSTTYRAHSGQGIVVKWGDGSGTGTGGTTEFYELNDEQLRSPGMELWMGVWGARARPQTSNWKEAGMVLESLRKEVHTGAWKVEWFSTSRIIW